MTNFIFKSQGTYKKLANKLEIILSEQRHQRADLNEIKYLLHKLQTNKDLQDTVNKFYDTKDQDVPIDRFEEDVPDVRDQD